jgi:cytochrome c2
MKPVILCAVLAWLLPWPAAADPATTFARKCSSCHTFGRGILVGPDLKGVTDRHPRTWLTAWIASSEAVIRSGDAVAVALFNKFKSQRMPDQSLSADDVSALIDYLAAGGPEADARRKARRAETATAAEIEMGRVLFVGQRAFASGGASCFSCHRLGNTLGAGGTLGPDLSSAYARYQDRGLSALLARGCFPRAVPTLATAALTDDELFALKAFMRREMQGTR